MCLVGHTHHTFHINSWKLTVSHVRKMKSLEEVIEDYRRVVEDQILDVQGSKKKLDLLVELQKVKNKRLNGEKLSDNEIHRCKSLLCWGDYAGCCGPSKDCPWNNAVSDALGVDYKELYEEKRETVRKYLNRVLGKIQMKEMG